MINRLKENNFWMLSKYNNVRGRERERDLNGLCSRLRSTRAHTCTDIGWGLCRPHSSLGHSKGHLPQGNASLNKAVKLQQLNEYLIIIYDNCPVCSLQSPGRYLRVGLAVQLCVCVCLMPHWGMKSWGNNPCGIYFANLNLGGTLRSPATSASASTVAALPGCCRHFRVVRLQGVASLW